MIGEFRGRDVVLIDPAKTAAHRLEQMLAERGLRGDHPTGQAHFFVSDVRTALPRRQTSSWASTKAAPLTRLPLTSIDKGQQKL